MESTPKALSDFVSEALKTVREISPTETAQFLQDPGVMILDVREPDEYAAGHLPGAINIPRGFLEVKADRVHPKQDARLANRAQRIICYCGGGHRSALAGKTLIDMGFVSVESMSGGWTGWIQSELPTEL